MRHSLLSLSITALTAFVLPSGNAVACDVCALYNSVESAQLKPHAFQIGLAEQFTSLSTIQEDGHRIKNLAHQHMQSSTTQILASLGVTDATSLQLSLPYINRRFKRVVDGKIDEGSEAGFGDLSIILKGTVYKQNRGDSSFIVQAYSGIKLPTGDSSRLAEQHSHQHDESEMEMQAPHLSRTFHEAHEEMGEMDEDGHAMHTTGAIHGHDLALGSGSLDLPVGAILFARWQRLYLAAESCYTLRSEGTHGYRAADHFTWSAGPGMYLLVDGPLNLAAKANFSGEHKGNDHQRGELQIDSAFSSTYVGPRLVASTNGGTHAELGIDFPISRDNSGIQAVPSYRLSGAVTVRF